ncbi:NAD-dependent 4,6-dehydratase LegB [Candidatus Woesearchaeota archaeon]|nr:NAD-dependent 4,6-dehydratase LegB [Candidatus Woesearchaeota archaeon]MBW3022161.1 NAD-dependent 4,6-dehydratase LegB [Candidatus Woesearchaeota archaeon]
MDLKDKKVLVTGAGGFIGSHLAEALVKKGCKVRAFVHYNPNNHWGWLEDSEYKDQIEVVLGDVRDSDSVLNAMKDIDVVFHLAALIGIPYSYESPLAYIRTNIEGTYNILQAARMLNTSKILITSTSETYGTAQYVPIDETHPAVGQSPYSATKIGADQIAISYHKAFNLPVTIVRPFNTYGPRQSARAIIPTIITQILDGKREIKLGNLTPTRDLNYVLDTVAGFISIAESDNTVGQVINIGANQEISMGELAQTIINLIGKDVKIVQDQQRLRPEKSEVERLRCDNSKIKELTDWSPKHDLKQGLSETIEWIKKNMHNYKSELYNV